MKYSILICIIVLISCKSDDQLRVENITSVVNALESNDDKKAYLESIFENHIDHRISETEAWNTHGRNSDEYNSLKDSHRKEDLILAEKISVYLNTYGYPSIMKVGQKSAVIPIAHITYLGDKTLLEENYNYFYDAYVFKDIREDLFYDYLVTLLDLSYQERRSLRSDYSQAETIDILVDRAKNKN